MGTMATVRVNTTQCMILYRDFTIQEVHGGDWEWCHDDYTPDTPSLAGTCQTLFECIEVVENWHDNHAEAAWMDHQQSLMEGGPDDSAYRRNMLAAGRGHLLGGR